MKGRKMFQPINSNILVEPILGDEKTAGGLFLPDSSREEKNEGKINDKGLSKQLNKANQIK